MTGKGERRGNRGHSQCKGITLLRRQDCSKSGRRKGRTCLSLCHALPHARPARTTGPPAHLPAPRVVAAFGAGQGDLLSAPNILRQGPSPPSPGEGTPKSLTLPHHPPPPDRWEGGRCLALQTGQRAWQCCGDNDTIPKGGQERASRKARLERCLRGFLQAPALAPEGKDNSCPPTRAQGTQGPERELLLPPSPTNH